MKYLVAAMLAFWMVNVCGVVRSAEAGKPPRPNIIFILADDLGIDGVSCYGADSHQTPRIDALAASGTRFTTCYAAPVCGPSRCLLMTGRYAFRTGGLTNQSWRADGPGAKSAGEYPMAKVLKSAGYVTGQAGKWRQVGEYPTDWGFDEFLSDNTGNGWYWQTHYIKNGKELVLPDETYGPDVIQKFSIDFIRRHKDQPFFLYYAMHLVHRPTLKTPDSSNATTDANKLYDDNIHYMDKQVGLLVDELEKLGIRQNTLVIFSGDNGTAVGYPAPVHGRMVNGWKGSMLEGGSRVPFIANWPGTTPAGKVLDDIISFADPLVSFAELAGAKLPEEVKYDGQSFATQLRGQASTPRSWAYVQLGPRWFVREPGFKMNEQGDLFDMSDAPFVEKPVAPDGDTEQSKAARQRLAAALKDLNPAAGKTDKEEGGGGKNKRLAPANATARAAGPWKSGDTLSGEQAPDVAEKSFEISAEIDDAGTDGVIISQGGPRLGYAVYVTGGKLAFAVRESGKLTAIMDSQPLPKGHLQIQATLQKDGTMALLIDGKQIAHGNAGGPIPNQPRAGLSIGKSGKGEIGEYTAPAQFSGTISNVTVKAN